MARTSKRSRGAGGLAVLGLAVWGVVAGPQWAFGHSRPMSAEEMVWHSPSIVVATVEERNVRWNQRHNLLFTDYVLSVSEALRGRPPARVTISMPGGSLDGENHRTCLTVDLEVGRRYLLFLADGAESTLSPITGSYQGAFAEVVDGGTSTAQPAAGGPPLEVEGRTATFDEFVGTIRDLVGRVEADPPVGSLQSLGENDLPSKDYDPDDAAAAGAPSFDPAAGRDVEVDLPHADPGADVEPTSGEEALRADGGGGYVYERRPPAPVVFNPFPFDWVWSPHDQYMMSTWNQYAPQLFRIMAPTGTWAWGNDRFDLAGWPSNATMIDQFGEGWGATTLGITWYRWTSGPIVEADIALNPAYSWTLDNEWASRDDTTPWGFEQTMLHELGHSWGLQHPWETQDVWWDSVMNYAPKWARLPILNTDDTNAVMSAYPGASLRDGLVSAYSTEDTSGSNHATYEPLRPDRSEVRQGETFALTGRLKIENCGTTSLVNPRVEVYLCPERMSWDGARQVKVLQFSDTIGTFTTYFAGAGSVTVPPNFPLGTYFLGLFLRDDNDDVMYNNSSWGRYPHTIRVTEGEDEGPRFLRGDADTNGRIELTDAIYLLRILFVLGTRFPCREAADFDDSGGVNLGDGIGIARYLYSGGPPPRPPFPRCGPDPNPPGLGCDRVNACP